MGWTNSKLIQGDVAEAVAQLKGEFGRVDVIGSGNLVQTLLRNDLVDRLNLWAFPVLLGSGKRLFAEGTVPTALRLVESATFPKGSVHLTYERARQADLRQHGLAARESFAGRSAIHRARNVCRFRLRLPRSPG